MTDFKPKNPKTMVSIDPAVLPIFDSYSKRIAFEYLHKYHGVIWPGEVDRLAAVIHRVRLNERDLVKHRLTHSAVLDYDDAPQAG